MSLGICSDTWLCHRVTFGETALKESYSSGGIFYQYSSVAVITHYGMTKSNLKNEGFILVYSSRGNP